MDMIADPDIEMFTLVDNTSRCLVWACGI